MPKHAYGVRCVTCGGDVKEFHTSSEAVYEYAVLATSPGWQHHVVELLERVDGDWTVWRSSDDAGDTP